MDHRDVLRKLDELYAEETFENKEKITKAKAVLKEALSGVHLPLTKRVDESETLRRKRIIEEENEAIKRLNDLSGIATRVEEEPSLIDQVLITADDWSGSGGDFSGGGASDSW